MIALFVPGDRPERFAKAAAAADLAILDLEDAVDADRKATARDAVARALVASPAAVCVRINALDGDHAAADLAMLAAQPPAAVMIPKAASAADVAAVRARVPGARVFALIESIAGLDAVDAIAAAGASGLAFGAYDFCAAIGARVTAEVLAPVRSRIVLAARRAGIEALDTPFAGLADPAGLADDARRSADFGFTGKLAIHPAQIAVIRSAFEPTAAELQRARTIVDAFGGGVMTIDGTMIDAPLLALARQTLARAPKGEIPWQK